MGSLKSPCRL